MRVLIVDNYDSYTFNLLQLAIAAAAATTTTTTTKADDRGGGIGGGGGGGIGGGGGGGIGGGGGGGDIRCVSGEGCGCGGHAAHDADDRDRRQRRREQQRMREGATTTNDDDDATVAAVDVVVIRNDQVSWETLRDDVLGHFDCVIVSPGPGRPDVAEDFGLCDPLLRAATTATGDDGAGAPPIPPILGVCLGHQGLASVLGGRVVRAPEPMHGRLSALRVVGVPGGTDRESGGGGGGGLFDGVEDGCRVVRYHSLAVDESSLGVKYHQGLPDCLRVTAWTDDPIGGGGRVVMGLEHATRPVWGVQFHPESISTEQGATIMRNFLRMARAAAGRRRSALPQWIREMTVVPTPLLRPLRDEDAQAGGGVLALRKAKPKPSVFVLDLDEFVDPRVAFEALFGDQEVRYWLDSAKVVREQRNFSYMGACSSPESFLIKYSCETRKVSIKRPNCQTARGAAEPQSWTSSSETLPPKSTFFHWMAETMDRYTVDSLSKDSRFYMVQRTPTTGASSTGNTHLPNDATAASYSATPLTSPPFDFVGGMVGYFGYEMKSETLPEGHQHGFAVRSARDTPDACFVFSDRVVAFDHAAGSAHLVALSFDGEGGGDGTSPPAAVLAWFRDAQCALRRRATTAAAPQPPRGPPNARHPLSLRLAHPRATYMGNISSALSSIAAGETYELCLTTRVTLRLAAAAAATAAAVGAAPVRPYDLYLRLRSGNPAPHGAFLELGDGLAVLQSSPERFLRCGADGWVEMRPIKGTVARPVRPAAGCEEAEMVAWREEDERRRGMLGKNEKDQAENLMIVDLIRNDLNLICAPETVTVPALFAVESYATVHQLVSTVRGRLRGYQDVPVAAADSEMGEEEAGKQQHGVARARLTALDALRATFPPGSMTGAPKLRSCRILEALEGGGPSCDGSLSSSSSSSPVPGSRGPYSGCLGFLSVSGACDMSVVIRTAVVVGGGVGCEGGRIDVGAGGAVVYLSDVEGEFDEMVTKAASVLPSILAAYGVGSDAMASLRE
ncbi:ADC synthase [Zopfochytrium polystomum]|nr:ADC synthase [Zopfochytrium polystomum]